MGERTTELWLDIGKAGYLGIKHRREREGRIATAVADLAKRLGVEAATVEVVGQEAVTWSDGSLGCAKPSFDYTQALVDGSRITLRAAGTDYEYHSAGSQEPFWCETPTQ